MACSLSSTRGREERNTRALRERPAFRRLSLLPTTAVVFRFFPYFFFLLNRPPLATPRLTPQTFNENIRSDTSPRAAEAEKKGYFEDRRPSSNMDPYVVCGMIFHTVRWLFCGGIITVVVLAAFDKKMCSRLQSCPSQVCIPWSGQTRRVRSTEDICMLPI